VFAQYVQVPRRVLAAALPFAVALTVVATATIGVMATHTSGGTGCPSGGFNRFITDAVEHADGTVTLPLHRGTSNGQVVYDIVTDASNGNAAAALGVNPRRDVPSTQVLCCARRRSPPTCRNREVSSLPSPAERNLPRR
jgi:hypothetical protein